MPISLSALLGVAFLGLAFLSTFLMFQFWGYPYDKERRKSECPQWKMNIHRGVGYAYFALYIVMMVQMVPRLWEYQVEFPARTVAHIMLGMTIGIILILKISILRWFRHFEEWMPFLGVALLTCTVLLSALSLPFVFKEHLVASSGETFSAANRARVRAQLAESELPPDSNLDQITSEKGLRVGRSILLDECTFCHDLKTAISRPRTPVNWLRTVERMAEKPTVGPRIDADETVLVTAYLVAITPALQVSAKAKRVQEQELMQSLEAIRELEQIVPPATPVDPLADGDTPDPKDPTATTDDPDDPKGSDPAGTDKPEVPKNDKPVKKPEPKGPDPAVAKKVYERICSDCHGLEDVDQAPPKSVRQVGALIERMIEENGMEASKRDLRLIRWHLIQTFVNKK